MGVFVDILIEVTCCILCLGYGRANPTPYNAKAVDTYITQNGQMIIVNMHTDTYDINASITPIPFDQIS